MKYVYIKKNKNISFPLIIGHIYDVQVYDIYFILPKELKALNINTSNQPKTYFINTEYGVIKGISESELNEYFEPLSINRLKKINKIIK